MMVQSHRGQENGTVMSKTTRKKIGVGQRLIGFLKPWLAFTGLYATFSICPFCGQSGCPTGIGSAGLVGVVMALFTQKWDILMGRRKGRKHQHTCDKEDHMTKKAGFVTCQANEIDAGYHPLGFRIDKGADPLNRYTQWTMDKDGNWINSKPVCFHSLPTDGWIKAEKNNGKTESR